MDSSLYTLLFPVSVASTLYLSALTVKTYFDCRTASHVRSLVQTLEIPLRNTADAVSDLSDAKSKIYSNVLGMVLDQGFVENALQILAHDGDNRCQCECGCSKPLPADDDVEIVAVGGVGSDSGTESESESESEDGDVDVGESSEDEGPPPLLNAI